MTLGRNEPCHCGSGKKYKKCCLEKDRLAEQERGASISNVIPFPGGNKASKEADKFVNELKRFISNELEWENQEYQELALSLFPQIWKEYRMRRQDDLDELMSIVMLWNDFSSQKQPKYRKPGGYAGALEYFVMNVRRQWVTQTELADKHGVSTGTLSRCYGNLLDFAEEKMLAEDWLAEQKDGMPNFGGTAAFSQLENEQFMHKLAKLIEEQQFESPDEVNAFLSQHMDHIDKLVDAELSDEQKAVELLVKAEQEPLPARRIQLVKEALRLDKGNGDAYVMLVMEANTLPEALKVAEEGLNAAAASLGPGYFEENKGHFWGLIETRPYMRLKFCYADLLKEQGDIAAAMQELEEMLELCPNDNIGARYDLLMLYLADQKLDRAEKLMQQFDMEDSASFCYDRVVLSYLKNGYLGDLDTLYKQAKRSNPHVPAYLLGKKRLPKQRPQYIGIGDENEAIEYALSHQLLWSNRNLSGLKDWMKRSR